MAFLKEINNFINKHKEINLSKSPFTVRIVGKQVWEKDNKIYRLSAADLAIIRLGFIQFINSFSNNFDGIMAEEHIIEHNQYYTLTEQKKLEPFEDILAEKIDFILNQNANTNDLFERQFVAKVITDYGIDYALRLNRIFKTFNVIWMHNKNLGLDNGKVKVFDYVANISMNSDAIIGPHRKELLKIKDIKELKEWI